jgi:hypothetical protein
MITLFIFLITKYVPNLSQCVVAGNMQHCDVAVK